MSVYIKTYAAATHKRPAGARPLSILMIGDMHGETYGRQNRDLLEAIRKMRPDFAVTVGDMMYAVPDFDISDLLIFFEELREICPVFAVNGNHETRMKLHTVTFGTIYKEYDHELQRMGIHVLNNSSISARIDGTPLRICGYEAPLEKYRKFRIPRCKEEELKEILGTCEAEPYTILLAHDPAFAKTYFKWGADLILSGHYHGGLIRIGRQALMSPYGFPLPRYGYGMYRNGEQTMIVTAGAGNHAVPIRIGNPKEIVQIIIDHAEE